MLFLDNDFLFFSNTDSATTLASASQINLIPNPEPLIAFPSAPDYEDLQLLSVKNLKDFKGPILSPLADISSISDDTRGEKLSDGEAATNLSAQTPDSTTEVKRTNPPAISVSKSYLSMLPTRPSSYKEPNASRDRKKVTLDLMPWSKALEKSILIPFFVKARLAILIHPNAASTSCSRSKKDFLSPHDHQVSSSISACVSHTECSRSITTRSISSGSLTSDLDSCFFSEIYDCDGFELKAPSETGISESKDPDFTERLYQECIFPTPSSISVGQNWGHGDDDLLESPQVISALLNSSRKATPFEKPSGDENDFEPCSCSPEFFLEAPMSVKDFAQFSIPPPTFDAGPKASLLSKL